MSNGQDAAREAEVNAIMKSGPDNINRYVITALMFLSENGCRKGFQDRADIADLQRVIGKKPREYDPQRGNWLQLGKLKAAGWPAGIIALFVGFAIWQHYQAQQNSEGVKAEVRAMFQQMDRHSHQHDTTEWKP